MITTWLKSYFLVIVALASIIGSTVAASNISNFVNVGSSDPSPLVQDASAQSLPFRADHHLKIKEKVGDPIRIEEWNNDADRNCEMSCIYVQFTPGKNGKAGLAFISDTPLDLSGAERVHFFLMGDKGGEMVKVKIAGKNPTGAQKADSPFKEKFAKSTNVVKLTNDWQRYEISLAGVDLKGITAPFAIELLKGNKTSATQAIYFKFIVYENEPVDQRFALATNATGNATALTADNATALTADNATALTADNSTALTADNATAADEGTGNETTPTSTSTNDTAAADTSEEQISNGTDIAPVEGQADENLAPIAMLAVDSLVAHPGDRVMLDGSLSNDPDGDEITYRWSQSDGPNAEIIDAETVTPTITIPPLERDDVITVDLIVSDGQTESNKASVVIDVQYVEEVEDAIRQDLLPDDDVAGQGWSDTACSGNADIVDCLIDSSDSTFVSSDRPDKTTAADLLFSFQDPSSAGINGSNNIAYVTAQVTAKKTGPSGFTSLIVDDPSKNEHYSTPSISIISDSFEEYGFTWENNPLTGEPWTMDSLNSLVAGYRHLAGQGSIQISEFKIIVASLVVQEEQESLPSSSATDEETFSAEESEPAASAEENGENDSDEDNTTIPEEEEPAASDESASMEDGEQEDQPSTDENEENPGQNDGTDADSDEPSSE